MGEAAMRVPLAPAGRWLAVDPAAAAALPVLQLLVAEPQVDLLLGALHRVAAVNHVPASGTKQEIENSFLKVYRGDDWGEGGTTILS